MGNAITEFAVFQVNHHSKISIYLFRKNKNCITFIIINIFFFNFHGDLLYCNATTDDFSAKLYSIFTRGQITIISESLSIFTQCHYFVFVSYLFNYRTRMNTRFVAVIKCRHKVIRVFLLVFGVDSIGI